MNTLQRALIEKAGHEYGFENVLKSDGHSVTLSSARHAAQVSIHLQGDSFLLMLPEGLLASELSRDYDALRIDNNISFPASNIAQLSQRLLRAAMLAQSLPNQVALNYETKVQDTLLTTPSTSTEIERLVRQRIGQDTFRKAMLDYWGSACAVTGINVPQVLRASHAKPWAECSHDTERLDVFNGFLLTANLDALFDRGVITFDDEGILRTSSRLSLEQQTALGLAGQQKLRWLAKEHRMYLSYHRTLVFC